MHADRRTQQPPAPALSRPLSLSPWRLRSVSYSHALRQPVTHAIVIQFLISSRQTADGRRQIVVVIQPSRRQLAAVAVAASFSHCNRAGRRRR